MKKRKKILNMQWRRKVPPDASSKSLTLESGQTRYFVHDPMGMRLQQEPDGSWLLPVHDGLGSVRGVLDENLTPLESHQYTPPGVPYGAQGPPQTSFGFTGEMTDPNGLVYLRNRYYNPALGVFPNPDPMPGNVQQPMSLNPYTYVQNNPVNFTDPSGMVSEDIYPEPPMPVSPPALGGGRLPEIDSRCLYDPATGWAHCTYDRVAAANYANVHQCEPFDPPNYPYFGGQGGYTNCANFVSQALHHGGMPMNREWHCSDNPADCALGIWTSVLGLYRFLTSKREVFGGPEADYYTLDRFNGNYQGLVIGQQWGTPFRISTGDLLFSFSKFTQAGTLDYGDYDHVSIIIGWPVPNYSLPTTCNPDLDAFINRATSGTPYITDHSGQARNYPPRPIDKEWTNPVVWRVVVHIPDRFAIRLK